MRKPRAAVSWSGGKDSCLALSRIEKQFTVASFVTMLTEDGERSRSHGLRPELLARQANILGKEIVFGRASWANYEERFSTILKYLREQGISHVIFGDIFLDDHRRWVERVCKQQGLEAVEPLWNEPTVSLVEEFLEIGGRASVVAVDSSRLGEEWLGRDLDDSAVRYFSSYGIDPCGEYGEYHTFVTTLPGSSGRIPITRGEIYQYSGYSAIDLSLSASRADASRHRQA
jgi:uncharacterized protein (TIGR00290 family)